MRQVSSGFLAVLCLALCAAFLQARTTPLAPETPPGHVLVGAWLAKDGTVFLFRKDGTFHGYDCLRRECWGNWVTLSATRIGFQSLRHDGSYRPQYAIIDKASEDSMDYIVTGGTWFIKANRIPVEKAEEYIKMVVDPQVHHPGETPTPSPTPEGKTDV